VTELRPDPLWELTVLPDPLAGIRGLAHGEGKGNGRGRGRRGNLSQILTLDLGG